MKRGAHRTPSRSSAFPLTPGVVTLSICKQVLLCLAYTEHIILIGEGCSEAAQQSWLATLPHVIMSSLLTWDAA